MMARKKKKKPAADTSAEAGESGETPDAGTVEPSAVVTRTLAPIDVRRAEPQPAEVHLSLEPEAVGSADLASAAGVTSTPTRDPDPASVDDVDLELGDESDGETVVARGGVGDASDDSDAPRDEHGDEADDEDHGESRAERVRKHGRRLFREITEEDVSEDARERRGVRGGDDSKNASESPARSPRASDASGAFAAALRSPAAFLRGLSRGARRDRRGSLDDGGATRDRRERLPERSSADVAGGAPGASAAAEETASCRVARREKIRDKRRAKRARRRLKRLVHAANTMGSAVSAKEQTTAQLALCLQLGLTTSLRNQKSAATFAAKADDALAEADVAKTTRVRASNVEDGSKLPSFRFVTHAPNRFERVRSAWGLSLPKYAESFALETRVARAGGARRDAASEERRRASDDDTARDVPSPRRARHARELSAGSSEGAGVVSLTDEGDGSDGVSEDDEGETRGRDAGRGDEGEPSGAGARDDEGTSDPAPVCSRRRGWFSERDGRTSEPSRERFSVASRRDAFSETRGDAGDADYVTLRPDVFLPTRTSLRVISSARASGKSSSWFFCSKDSRFLVKTCTTQERDVLLDILGEYSRHAVRHRDTSLLPQYYGLYTIEVGSRSAHFIIMNYWFATMHAISRRFDLKGSTKGRRASRKERAKGDAAVLKDLDFLESADVVQNPMAEEVKAAIATDVAFMERNRLIDYSMMVGLHFYDDPDARPGAGANGDGGGDAESGPRITRLRGARDGARRSVSARVAGGGDGAGADVGAEETGAPLSPGRRRRRPGYGSFSGSNGGNTGPLARFSDASPPATPTRDLGEPDLGAGFDDARVDAAEPEADALPAGPFAEPAADDTRLQFQLRALETPFGLAYLGIIDILTQYGPAKAAENLCFGALMCGADISCQPPDAYARRFKRFIDAHVLKVAPASETPNAVAPLEIEAPGARTSEDEGRRA